MQRARAVIGFAGVFTLCVTVAPAEDAPQPVAGSRVRVEVSTAEERLVGRLLALDDKHLNLQVEDEKEPRIFSREDITALAVSGGRRSRGRGALIGAGVAVALGAVIGVASWHDADDYSPNMLAMFLAYVAAPIGALIGLAIPPGERWKDVPLDTVQVSVRAVPGRGGGVFVAVGF